MTKTYKDTAIFLNRLKWKTIAKEFNGMVSVCIDCYNFKFKRPLQEQEQYALLAYMETLDLTSEHAIINVAIWLYQHEIPFGMSFKYNREIPLSFNLERRKRPKEIFKSLEKRKDAVMAYDLVSNPYSRKEQITTMEKPNTAMHYLYRDADNYKQPNSIVLAGHPTDEQKRTILESLATGDYFIPEAIGLPCNRFGSWTESDHPWCELYESGFEETKASPDTDMTWQQLADAFAAHKDCWEEPESKQVSLPSVRILNEDLCMQLTDNALRATKGNPHLLRKENIGQMAACILMASGIPVYKMTGFHGMAFISDESHTEYPETAMAGTILYVTEPVPETEISKLLREKTDLHRLEGDCDTIHDLMTGDECL